MQPSPTGRRHEQPPSVALERWTRAQNADSERAAAPSWALVMERSVAQLWPAGLKEPDEPVLGVRLLLRRTPEHGPPGTLRLQRPPLGLRCVDRFERRLEPLEVIGLVKPLVVGADGLIERYGERKGGSDQC